MKVLIRTLETHLFEQNDLRGLRGRRHLPWPRLRSCNRWRQRHSDLKQINLKKIKLKTGNAVWMLSNLNSFLLWKRLE